MKLLIKYLKLNILPMILVNLCALTVVIVSLLCNVDWHIIIYEGAVCLFFAIIIGIYDFVKFVSKHRTLLNAQKNIVYTLENLPASENIIDDDYRSIIEQLFENARDMKIEYDNGYYDMVNYYNKWAHQIKTPISAMRLILETSECDEKTMLNQELMRIEQYSDMVLAYARINSDTNDFIIKEYDLDKIIKSAVRRYSSVFIRKKIELDYKKIDKVVLTDEKQLLFVIEQIISNSLKYTKAGKISIYFKDDSLFISDTGIGIAKDDLPRIFENGYTGLNGRIEKSSTGIGLYLTKCICSKLGHKISADSELYKGTTIKITFNEKRLEIE